MTTPILCLDFDGVLHSYTSGWEGADKISDPPVDGAIDWLRSLLGCPEDIGIGPRYLDFRVAIFSARSNQRGGIKAMKKWLKKHGLSKYELELIDFPKAKPPAFLGIDDRVLTFTGVFPSVADMKNFKPWNKKGV